MPFAGFAIAQPRQISIIPPPSSILVPPPSPPMAPGTFNSPGLDFSIIIPNYTIFTFGTAQQASLCAAITSGWTTGNNNPGVSCSVGSVTTFDSTRILVSGFAYFTYATQPTTAQLYTATILPIPELTL